jgi:hypothetical protein
MGGEITMFSFDNVLEDLWPQASPRQKNLLRRLLYEQEFQQFAARHPHLKGLDMVEQVLEHLQIRCTILAHCFKQISEQYSADYAILGASGVTADRRSVD